MIILPEVERPEVEGLLESATTRGSCAEAVITFFLVGLHFTCLLVTEVSNLIQLLRLHIQISSHGCHVAM
jgi:hypothetical protein